MATWWHWASAKLGATVTYQELDRMAREGLVTLQPSGGLALTPAADLEANGQGVPQNYAAALKLFRLAADQGNAVAQYNIGLIYKNGNGVPQNYAQAVKWYRLAADQGNADAQSNLGHMYGDGKGLARDYAEALKWYRLAADQGNAVAQANLGAAYHNGDGVAQDFIAAHMWFNIAGANGDSDATKNRDMMAAKMTPADLSEAQRRAKVCMASNYQDCD